MAELTPEAFDALTKRVEALEKKLAEQESDKIGRKKDWRRVVGISEDNEFTRQMQAEIEARSDEERRAAQQGGGE